MGQDQTTACYGRSDSTAFTSPPMIVLHPAVMRFFRFFTLTADMALWETAASFPFAFFTRRPQDGSLDVVGLVVVVVVLGPAGAPR